MEHMPFILTCLIILFMITWPFTVLFHELGHAIPAILMTKEKVSIYIGSYGDPGKSLKLKFGLLEVWFKYNPFLWKRGLCVPSAEEISINKQIIYILTGPLASTMTAIVACYIAFSFDIHSSIQLFLIVFFASSIFDLVTNLSPNSTPIKLHDGRLTYNDGYQLKQLFYYKRLPKVVKQAWEQYNQKDYKKAAVSFDKLLKDGLGDANTHRLAIYSHFQIKNFTRAKELSERLMEKGTMNSDDFSTAALASSKLEEFEHAFMLYDKSLYLDPQNTNALNNKGFTLNLLGKYEEAIPLFDKVIEIGKDLAYSYNNRGLSKIKLGMTEEGLQDIEYSFKLDSDNSYAYRNLGIYHMDKKEYDKALELFRKAKNLDDSTHDIDKLILKAESKKN